MDKSEQWLSDGKCDICAEKNIVINHVKLVTTEGMILYVVLLHRRLLVD